MDLGRRRALRLAGLALAMPALSRTAMAQAWPSRPIRWIVPYPAGGTTDLVARLVADFAGERLGQPIVIENKPGGGTNIGVQQVVSSPADGYTLLFTVATNAINPSLYKTLPFDFLRDIVPVSGLAELPLVLVIRPNLPVTTVSEFIAHCKANPGKVTVASFGARTVSHLAIELLKSSTGIDVVHVPYRGGAPMLTDMIGGRIEAGVDALPNSLPHIRSGAARVLAVLPSARTPTLPDVPTVGETITGYEVSTWSGVGVPKGTPNDIVTRLNREINAALSNPGIIARLAEAGAAPLRFSPEEAKTRIAADTEKWAKVVKAAGIEPE